MIHEIKSSVDVGSDTEAPAPLSIFEERESNVRSYSRSFPTTFSSARGALLYDVRGACFLDFLSGAGALNYGHNHPTIKAAILNYLADDGITHGLDLETAAKGTFLHEFTERILEPRGLPHRIQFPGPTGTNAVEAAFKIARKATGRRGVFSFMGGFHGHSLGSLAATSNRQHREAAGISLDGVTFLPFPFGAMAQIDTLAYLRAVLNDTHSGIDLPAAVIVETVQAEGGVAIAPVDWLQGLREICDDYGIVLIVDEIQTGCGRTGPFFSFERAGIVPDIITVSKSISGYGLPMAITMMRPELDVLQPGDHTGTFRGYQLAFVAAVAALGVFEKEEIEATTAANSALTAQLLELEVLALDPRIEARGLGMIWGVETAAIDPTGKLAAAIARKSFDNGLIIERVGRNDTALKILPPLNIEAEQLAEGIHILADATRSSLER
ncbi:MAG TPA: diaminobutyrate--2-oxoglutarate transaminase [Acidimicrobiales bacterium]|nr:diaminobutyrate--2-oxoglutarate transaminase [Acidimicrobiales bacterium]